MIPGLFTLTRIPFDSCSATISLVRFAMVAFEAQYIEAFSGSFTNHLNHSVDSHQQQNNPHGSADNRCQAESVEFEIWWVRLQ